MSLKLWIARRVVYHELKKFLEGPVMNILGRNWKTTLLGSGGILSILYAGVIQPLMDGDPTTKPMWGVVLSAVCTAAIGLVAKDHDVFGPTPGK